MRQIKYREIIYDNKLDNLKKQYLEEYGHNFECEREEMNLDRYNEKSINRVHIHNINTNR